MTQHYDASPRPQRCLRMRVDILAQQHHGQDGKSNLSSLQSLQGYYIKQWATATMSMTSYSKVSGAEITQMPRLLLRSAKKVAKRGLACQHQFDISWWWQLTGIVLEALLMCCLKCNFSDSYAIEFFLCITICVCVVFLDRIFTEMIVLSYRQWGVLAFQASRCGEVELQKCSFMQLSSEINCHYL